MATAMRPPETMAKPGGVRMRTPPRMVPMRMARNVPASISALPASNSAGARWAGRMPY
jgi:hypothetical protein